MTTKTMAEQELRELKRLNAVPQEQMTQGQVTRYEELLKRFLDEKLVAWPDDEED